MTSSWSDDDNDDDPRTDYESPYDRSHSTEEPLSQALDHSTQSSDSKEPNQHQQDHPPLTEQPSHLSAALSRHFAKASLLSVDRAISTSAEPILGDPLPDEYLRGSVKTRVLSILGVGVYMLYILGTLLFLFFFVLLVMSLLVIVSTCRNTNFLKLRFFFFFFFFSRCLYNNFLIGMIPIRVPGWLGRARPFVKALIPGFYMVLLVLRVASELLDVVSYFRDLDGVTDGLSNREKVISGSCLPVIFSLVLFLMVQSWRLSFTGKHRSYSLFWAIASALNGGAQGMEAKLRAIFAGPSLFVVVCISINVLFFSVPRVFNMVKKHGEFSSSPSFVLIAHTMGLTPYVVFAYWFITDTLLFGVGLILIMNCGSIMHVQRMVLEVLLDEMAVASREARLAGAGLRLELIADMQLRYAIARKQAFGSIKAYRLTFSAALTFQAIVVCVFIAGVSAGYSSLKTLSFLIASSLILSAVGFVTTHTIALIQSLHITEPVKPARVLKGERRDPIEEARDFVRDSERLSLLMHRLVKPTWITVPLLVKVHAKFLLLSLLLAAGVGLLLLPFMFVPDRAALKRVRDWKQYDIASGNLALLFYHSLFTRPFVIFFPVTLVVLMVGRKNYFTATRNLVELAVAYVVVVASALVPRLAIWNRDPPYAYRATGYALAGVLCLSMQLWANRYHNRRLTMVVEAVQLEGAAAAQAAEAAAADGDDDGDGGGGGRELDDGGDHYSRNHDTNNTNSSNNSDDERDAEEDQIAREAVAELLGKDPHDPSIDERRHQHEGLDLFVSDEIAVGGQSEDDLSAVPDSVRDIRGFRVKNRREIKRERKLWAAPRAPEEMKPLLSLKDRYNLLLGLGICLVTGLIIDVLVLPWFAVQKSDADRIIFRVVYFNVVAFVAQAMMEGVLNHLGRRQLLRPQVLKMILDINLAVAGRFLLNGVSSFVSETVMAVSVAFLGIFFRLLRPHVPMLIAMVKTRRLNWKIGMSRLIHQHGSVKAAREVVLGIIIEQYAIALTEIFFLSFQLAQHRGSPKAVVLSTLQSWLVQSALTFGADCATVRVLERFAGLRIVDSYKWSNFITVLGPMCLVGPFLGVDVWLATLDLVFP
jgi:hypothetical protein